MRDLTWVRQGSGDYGKAKIKYHATHALGGPRPTSSFVLWCIIGLALTIFFMDWTAWLYFIPGVLIVILTLYWSVKERWYPTKKLYYGNSFFSWKPFCYPELLIPNEIGQWISADCIKRDVPGYRTVVKTVYKEIYENPDIDKDALAERLKQLWVSSKKYMDLQKETRLNVLDPLFDSTISELNQINEHQEYAKKVINDQLSS